MWTCRVGRGLGGEVGSEGSGIRSRARDAAYRECGRAGVPERKGVQGVRDGQGIQPRTECGRAGVREEQEGRGDAGMSAGRVPGRRRATYGYAGRGMCPRRLQGAHGRRVAAAPSDSPRGPGAEATRALRGGRDRDRDPP